MEYSYTDGKPFDGISIYPKIKNVHFNDYLEYKNEEYYSLINEYFGDYSFPEDYSELSFEDICRAGEYSLKQQQKFAGRIFNTHVDNRGMLIYHGMGSGKTQTSIVIGEAFKHKSVTMKEIPGRTPSYVLIVVPASLTEQYFSELVGRYVNNKVESASGEILIWGERQYYLDSDTIDALNKRYSSLDKYYSQIETLKRDNKNSEIPAVESKITEIKNGIRIIQNPVSYTHLTLPTSDLV